ncbi:MAG: hypothetical protein EOP53_01460 [Sphingobacteriales bacterium]|nr:MAG: hypothetical protein EOP53_01460 [Sphingobacteriales bacterium]
MHLKLYKSSAGSGKTFTLVKEYLKICLPQPEKFRRVVAITFTNAAASEMKERIVSKLEQLAMHEDLPYEQMLLSEGLTQVHINNAAKLLEEILYNYTDFHISTIDSFFHKILRAFSKELNLPMNFDIFLDTQEALDYAVDNFLYRSHMHADVHRVLVAYVRERIEQGSSWNVRSNLSRMAQELVKDNSILQGQTDLAEIAAFIDELRALIAQFENGMDTLGRKALQQIDEYGLCVDDFKYKGSGPAGYFQNILKNRKKYQPGVRFTRGITESAEWLNAKAPNARQCEEAIETFLMPIAAEVFQLYTDDYPKYISAREILRNIYTFAVYDELNKLLAEYRTQNDVILVSDFTKILAKHIINEDISFIYSKIGARFDHFLIDEFQDTSALQWLGLRPLVENAVAQGSNCLLVGDSKQAIYRWRGGEVELIEKQISERDFPEQVSRLTLAQNFRSKTEVIHFNNHFFKSIKALFAKDIYEYKLLGQIFEDVEQQVGSKKAEGGYVEVQFFAKEGRGKESYNAKARQYLLDSITSCLQSGYSLKDISVLVRDKKDANEVARTLFKENIAFITQDSLSVDHSPAVRLLFSLLYFLNDPRNDLAKTQITFLYLTYFEKPETEVTFSELLNDFTRHDDGLYARILPFDFTKNIFELSLLPLYELVEELVRVFHLNREPDAYLQRFQDVVLEYALTKNQSIKGFLDWWQAGRYSVVLPEDQDAVQIMTIHKSKGLEFPVVIMPFCNWDFSSSRNTNILWVEPEEAPFNRFSRLPINHSKNLAESTFANDFEREEALISIDNLNLLYVAFTRAQECLLISSHIHTTASEGIKNISQLLAKVLLPGEKLTPERTLQFGEATHHHTDIILHNSAEYLELPEYPVYAWRTEIDLEKLYNDDSKNASTHDILLSNLPSEANLFTYIEGAENALGKIANLLLYQKNDASIGKTLLIPGYGNFKPQKAFSSGGEIYLLHAVNDVDSEQDVLAAYSQYAKFIAVQNGVKVFAYLVDLSRKKLELISED